MKITTAYGKTYTLRKGAWFEDIINDPDYEVIGRTGAGYTICRDKATGEEFALYTPSIEDAAEFLAVYGN